MPCHLWGSLWVRNFCSGGSSGYSVAKSSSAGASALQEDQGQAHPSPMWIRMGCSQLSSSPSSPPLPAHLDQGWAAAYPVPLPMWIRVWLYTCCVRNRPLPHQPHVSYWALWPNAAHRQICHWVKRLGTTGLEGGIKIKEKEVIPGVGEHFPGRDR